MVYAPGIKEKWLAECALADLFMDEVENAKIAQRKATQKKCREKKKAAQLLAQLERHKKNNYIKILI